MLLRMRSRSPVDPAPIHVLIPADTTGGFASLIDIDCLQKISSCYFVGIFADLPLLSLCFRLLFAAYAVFSLCLQLSYRRLLCFLYRS